MGIFSRGKRKSSRAPKKPKFAKYPKKPKASASLETIKNWKTRCDAVDKRNGLKAKAYNEKIDKRNEAKRLRQSISGLSRTPKVHALRS